ncbi:MFS general substrate transporter [Ophiobolus disseminans]|uniref:MFS general substrate transporter n=1 Tax=Ophiobolus disseminans TaxID=1469910 RepID=A0A6A6ZAV5_9PLEO|nr:MFS general substrate transporter [Ophiobolus disseminans]
MASPLTLATRAAANHRGGPRPFTSPTTPMTPAGPYSPSPASAVPLLRLNTAATGGRGAEHRSDWKPERRHWLIMITLSFISFVVSLDATILVTALPEISRSLYGSSADSFWTGTSYLLTCAVFQPVIAAASHCFGRKRQLVLSLVLFTFGTALCAVAYNFTIMLIGRCVQGIGGGGIIAMTQVIFCDMIPLRQQPRYFSIVLASWSIGSIIGPVVGGSLVQTSTWRWCFHINFPFCIVGLVATEFFIRDSDFAFEARPRRMDWLGALLFVGGLTSFLVGISWGGTQYPWTSAATLAPTIIGALGCVAFVVWQVHIKPDSLLPMSLFGNASAIAAFYCALVNGFLYSALYYVPFYLMSVRGASPVRAGIDLFPAVCLLVPGSVIVAILTSHLGHFRWAIWLGLVIANVGCGLFILFDERTAKVVFAVALAVFGVGNGMVLTGVNVGTQAIAKAEDRPMAACMYGFMRSLGMPIGVALAGAIFQNAMSSALSESGLPTGIALDSERFLFVLQAMPKEDPRKATILACYSKGFRQVFITMTVISATALLASSAIRRFKMDAVLPVTTGSRLRS